MSLSWWRTGKRKQEEQAAQSVRSERGRGSRSGLRRCRFSKPHLEQLEDRTAPASLFGSTTAYPAGVGPFGLATGDFNGDGKDDIASMDAGDASRGTLAKVSVHLSNATAGFTQAPGSPVVVGFDARSVTTGDFNRDGRDDFAAAIYSGSPGFSVRVFLSVTGGFTEAAGSPYLVGQTQSGMNVGEPRWVTTGDFDGNGVLDLVTANQHSNTVSLLLGTGTGSFTSARTFPAGQFPVGLAVGDFNNDGRQDLVAWSGSSQTLTILFGDGGGGVSNSKTLAVSGAVAVADFNRDGKQDLAAAGRVLLGDGAGNFSDAPGRPEGGGGTSVIAADLNLDGIQDVAFLPGTGSGSNLGVALGDGTGRFAQAPGSPYPAPNSPVMVATGDFNGDGWPDLATANGAGNFSVLLNGGPIVTLGDFVWEDRNGDGVQDAGDLGIPGVTLTLSGTGAGGVPITDHAITDGSGRYLFTEPPGAYTVTVDDANLAAGGALVGFVASPTLQGSDRTADSNPKGSGTTPAALAAGQRDLTGDFGYYRPGRPETPYLDAVLRDHPAAYWRLGEMSGTTAIDASGNGRIGTYFNGVALGQPGADLGAEHRRRVRRRQRPRALHQPHRRRLHRRGMGEDDRGQRDGHPGVSGERDRVVRRRGRPERLDRRDPEQQALLLHRESRPLGERRDRAQRRRVAPHRRDAREGRGEEDLCGRGAGGDGGDGEQHAAG